MKVLTKETAKVGMIVYCRSDGETFVSEFKDVKARILTISGNIIQVELLEDAKQTRYSANFNWVKGYTTHRCVGYFNYKCELKDHLPEWL